MLKVISRTQKLGDLVIFIKSKRITQVLKICLSGPETNHENKLKAKTWRWNPCLGKRGYILWGLDPWGFRLHITTQATFPPENTTSSVLSVSGGLTVPCWGADSMFRDLISILQVCSHLPGRQAEAGSVPEAVHGNVQGHSGNGQSQRQEQKPYLLTSIHIVF